MERDPSNSKVDDPIKVQEKLGLLSPGRYSTSDIVTIICCASLASIMLVTTLTVMVGLFDASVDNSEIFKMVTPAFNMIVGAFVGTIAGIKIGKDDVK
jgi:hypothetical protein